MAAISSNIPIGITNDVDRFVSWAPMVTADKVGQVLDCSGYTHLTIAVYGVFDGITWALQVSNGDFTLAPGDQAYSDRLYYDAGTASTTQEPILVNNISGTTPAERVYTMRLGGRYVRPGLIGVPTASVILFTTAVLQRR